MNERRAWWIYKGYDDGNMGDVAIFVFSVCAIAYILAKEFLS